MGREVLIVLSSTIGLLGGRRGRERAALWWRRTIGMLHVARVPLQCMELEDVDETAPCGRVARWRMVSRFDGPRDWELLGADAMCWAVRRGDVSRRRRSCATVARDGERSMCRHRTSSRLQHVGRLGRGCRCPCSRWRSPWVDDIEHCIAWTKGRANQRRGIMTLHDLPTRTGCAPICSVCAGANVMHRAAFKCRVAE